MPPEFEKYSDNPKFTIINIPPNFMFQAKIFKPSRLSRFQLQFKLSPPIIDDAVHRCFEGRREEAPGAMHPANWTRVLFASHHSDKFVSGIRKI
ncbi:MAG: hypothetical protein FRX49_04552 [Trebouxia sp. A1-2]|nr:MAG: hypothetical protein FRX49_04552 [Trebouxia sp. A1-2]